MNSRVLLVVLLLLLIFGLPAWPHHGFGYGYLPSGLLGTVFVILLVLILLGRF